MTVTQYLADWRPYPFEITETRLDFDLAPRATRVRSQIDFRRKGAGDLVLDGAGLKTLSLAIDGRPLDPAQVAGERLVIPAADLPDAFTFSAEVEIDPEANTALEGLYLSGGMFCTQCEAEGFRHITWYPDRPDVMAPFRVTIRSDQPVLLSNGNPVSQAPGQAVWHDPWPKPAYLFALVAGALVAVPDSFTTLSGRKVALNVWVRPGDQDRAGYAMESLIRSMKWDEEAYGREYDLDVFNIVAVDDFNMGAMENKGLNIFNSKLVLASAETATDGDYERIEGVIGHEYFHNWTGNRITCRDWFQLCLKEGLTVFRDQQFTSDMRSAAVKRIHDVQTLRARQFREDAGPLAHPPRPDHYQEINNFYTATVYEKGAEVIGMLKRLVGDQGYRRALDLYFDRHDGQACTIEDWIKVFEDATGRDLTQFKRWYTDAGTPRLTLSEDWQNGRLTLNFRQETAPTPGQPEKPPRVVPIALGLIGPNGDEVLPTTVLEMTEAEQSFHFDGLGARPVVSLLRGFSAPVTVAREIAADEQALLLAHDTDPYARWQAGHDLALDALIARATAGEGGAEFSRAIGGLLDDAEADPAFAALCLSLPGEEEIATTIAARGQIPDPDAIHAGREALARDIARAHEPALARLYEAMQTPGPYRPDAEGAARRSLRLACLGLLSRIDGAARAEALFAAASNMTERQGALECLIAAGKDEKALASFAQQFAGNRLVMDKWFMVQPLRAAPDRAVARARDLAARPDFDWKNPNRFRALIGGLTANHAAFHAADGSGYGFTVDWLMRLDPVNPQTTARMCSAFETWTRYDAGRQAHARAALNRLAAMPDLSRNTSEMVTRILAGGA
ncbi:aminopeptidase N [Paracoccus sp. P2]|uniref:Aminopeptidase N n=1 Tax=Paracoccus pantotrophus TaxID=82367 RepID=A0A7H9BRJ0_PARPN|nr:aminopeptidase N [Paracoccus pantotrophus]MDF3855715.1 aminopeptidase N [Paracoccus pantotrophus]QLH13619.1 aminopeptidase N [Paracoccus pantotrophus]RDD99561.1 aminopeptidase N [Paracoccus pantotrophus]RNI17097.1 aminopeptidase N [Paracoccus pantotrophus]WGR67218.1 aminopeptidase N [Paracoccus pantotrophus]